MKHDYWMKELAKHNELLLILFKSKRNTTQKLFLWSNEYNINVNKPLLKNFNSFFQNT